MLTPDGASVLLTVMALRSIGESGGGSADTLGSLTVGTFVAGGPIVHFAHGNAGKGLDSSLCASGCRSSEECRR